eukprot:SAG22_NODE_5998_length_918_cov_1.413919_2_plen_63_part_00
MGENARVVDALNLVSRAGASVDGKTGELRPMREQGGGGAREIARRAGACQVVEERKAKVYMY